MQFSQLLLSALLCLLLGASASSMGLLSSALAVHKKAKGGKKGAGAGAGIAKTSKASKGKGDKGGKGEKDGEVEKRNVAHNKMTKIEVAQVPLKKSKGEAEGGEEEEEEEGGEKEDEDALIKEQTKFTGTQQMVISISSMVLSRMIFKVDYSDPQTLMLARLAFAAYLLLSQALFWFLRRQVTIRDDRHVLQKTSVGGGLMGAGLTAVMSGDPAAILGALSGKKEGKEQLMTVKQHDLAEIRKLASSVLFELLGVTFVHFVNKNTAPLLLVPMWGVTNKLKAPIVLLHLFRLKPVGTLARPFKSPLETAMAQMGPGGPAGLGGAGVGATVETETPVDTQVGEGGEGPTIVDAEDAEDAEDVLDLDEVEKEVEVEEGVTDEEEEGGDEEGEEEGSAEEEEAEEGGEDMEGEEDDEGDEDDDEEEEGEDAEDMDDDDLLDALDSF